MHTKLYQANGDILLNCKAWNGRVVMQFLASALLAAFRQGYSRLDDRLPIVARCLTLFCIRNPAVRRCLAMVEGNGKCFNETRCFRTAELATDSSNSTGMTLKTPEGPGS